MKANRIQLSKQDRLQDLKLKEILKGTAMGNRFEASGVCLEAGSFYVVFDNLPHIVRVDSDLSKRDRDFVFRQAENSPNRKGEVMCYEDITYHTGLRRFCLLVEALKYKKGVYRPRIVEFDEEFNLQAELWVDYDFKTATGQKPNKGLEGLAYVNREGKDYLLAICEGNFCQAGKAGRTATGGTILVLRRGKKQWKVVKKIKLPKLLGFTDYSALDVLDNRVVVVSQSSAAVWIGNLRKTKWRFKGAGELFYFPLDKDRPLHCNIEGVAWVSPDEIATVSDRSSKEDRKNCKDTEQALHVFRLPEETG